ncbi:MAG: helix-turn-helix domain-containing protein [Rivularia sp. (in: cyanobacteria)]
MQLSAPQVAIKWKLAHLMLEQDIKTGDLAEVTGLHPGTISKLKACRVMPKRLDRDTFEKLCQALKCTPGDLLVIE